MPCRAANWRARAGSRAASAVTTTSGTSRAGLISAAGVIRAAPSVPTRRRSTVASLLFAELAPRRGLKGGRPPGANSAAAACGPTVLRGGPAQRQPGVPPVQDDLAGEGLLGSVMGIGVQAQVRRPGTAPLVPGQHPGGQVPGQAGATGA